MSRLRTAPAPELAQAFAALRDELGITEEFGAEALDEAATPPPLPPAVDATDLELVTIDPEGSTDLDQAVHLAREGTGFRVRYAIADVGAFVHPGSALDAAARERGETLYAPDTRVPLHPPSISEDTASLLAGKERPALLWDIHLDAEGVPGEASLSRVRVRSRAQLTYDEVQRALDEGRADEQALLLREVGTLRQERARERGAVDLPTLEQRVQLGPDGRPELTFRVPLPVEDWNAQISLLTGAVAARMMLEGGVGLLRTMPDHDPEDVASLRRSALALGVDWPVGRGYSEVVSALDPHDPQHAAVLVLAVRLLRGAGYTAFDGAEPELATHSAVGGAYAHVTAPLRRLADRFGLETCLALSAGRPIPDGIRRALPELPELMVASRRRSGELERAGVDLAEALLLADRVGERFTATVVESGADSAAVQVHSPAVRARCDGQDLEAGSQVQVELTTADPATRTVRFRS